MEIKPEIIHKVQINNQYLIYIKQQIIGEINYIIDNDLLSLLDDNTKIICEIRKKYPESSLAEIAQIANVEYGYNIGKSGVNHNFIKIAALVKRHKDSVVKNEKKDNI